LFPHRSFGSPPSPESRAADPSDSTDAATSWLHVWARASLLAGDPSFAERQRDPRTQDRTKSRWKAIHKGIRARRKLDPKLRDD
jgi:hypothetical protein